MKALDRYIICLLLWTLSVFVQICLWLSNLNVNLFRCLFESSSLLHLSALELQFLSLEYYCCINLSISYHGIHLLSLRIFTLLYIKLFLVILVYSWIYKLSTSYSGIWLLDQRLLALYSSLLEIYLTSCYISILLWFWWFFVKLFLLLLV